MTIIKKLISITFATLSLVLLFSPWAVFKYKDDIHDKLKQSIGSSYYSVESFSELKTVMREQLKEDLQDATEDLRKVGVRINVNKLVKIFDCLIDLDITPSETDYIATTVSPAIKNILKVYDENLTPFGIGTLVSEDYVDIARNVRLGFNVYHILYIVTFAAFALAVIAIITDKIKFSKLLYFLIRLVMAAAFVVFVIVYNDRDNLPEEAQMALTLWPFLAVLLAIPDEAYLWIVDRLAGKVNLKPATAAAGNIMGDGAAMQTADVGKTAIPVSGGWTCPDCGMANSSDSRFCAGCGKPNPNIVTCPNCGTVLSDHEKFCPNCGTVIEWAPTELICPNCGASNSLDSMFCQECGTKLQEAAQEQE